MNDNKLQQDYLNVKCDYFYFNVIIKKAFLRLELLCI